MRDDKFIERDKTMDNSKLPINQLIARINVAADNGESMDLSADEVRLIAKNFGNLVMIPVYDMDNFPVDKYIGKNDKNINDK